MLNVKEKYKLKEYKLKEYKLKLNGGAFIHYEHKGKKKKINITEQVSQYANDRLKCRLEDVIDKLKAGLEERIYIYLNGKWLDERFYRVRPMIDDNLSGITPIAEEEIAKNITRNN